MISRSAFAPLLILTLLVVGCDGSPTQAEDQADFFDEEIAFFLQEARAPTSATPEERVEAAVAHAWATLERARAHLGPDASDEVRTLLAAAAASCRRADDLILEERLRAAARAAMACARGAREAVFQARAERVADFQTRAEAAVTDGAELLAAAARLITDDSPPQAQLLLDRAARLLAEAQAALDAQRYREAVVKARRAGAMAERIIGALG